MLTDFTTENVLIALTTFVAIITAIITTIIAVFLLQYFINPQQKQPKIMTMKSVENSRTQKRDIDNKSDEKPNNIQRKRNKSNTKPESREKQRQRVEISKYFGFSGSSVVIFNALCSIFNAIYCIYLMVDPENNKMTFYKHPSYFLRICSTISWYIGTGSVIWFFNGRLFYAFNGSMLQTSKTLFRFINIFITVYGLISLICAYTGVFYFDDLIVQEIAFTSFRVSYLIIIFIILYIFCKRLLLLHVQMQNLSAIECISKTAHNNEPKIVIHSSNSTSTDNNKSNIANSQQSMSDASFMELTARNSVLVFITATSVLSVTLSWTAFRWIILSPSRTTLLIPMNMASIDSLINSISVIMLFSFGNKLYGSCCGCCHKCFIAICGCITVNDVFT
eukprot:494468_1